MTTANNDISFEINEDNSGRDEYLEQITDLEERISFIVKQKKSCEEERNKVVLHAKTDTRTDVEALLERQKFLENEVIRLEQDRINLENEANELADEFFSKCVVDKRRILKNIRNLMKVKDVKVGQIENREYCSPGYMSRLESRRNLTTPSLEFIAVAADKLGVDMDLLINGHIDELPETDMYMLEFISELVAQTNKGEISWSRIENLNLNDRYGFCDYQTGYKSMFYDYVGLKDEPVMFAKLPGGNSKIFVINVRMQFSKDGIEQAFTEVYLLDSENIRTPLYNTYDNKALTEETKTLYASALKASKNIHISDSARTAIDQFMATKKRGD